MESIMQIVSALATSAIGYLFWRMKKREDRQEAELLELRREEQEAERRHKEEFRAIGDCLRALSRDRILQGYRYYRKQGGVSPQDLETMTKLYEAYHALGGNGTITTVYKKITELPLKEDVP